MSGRSIAVATSLIPRPRIPAHRLLWRLHPMNTALLLMSSAWIAGSDPGCTLPCAVPAMASCDPCAAGPGLFARLKARLPSPGCGAPCGAPLISRPLFAHSSAAACDPCASSSPGLLAKLKAKFAAPACVSASPCSTSSACASYASCGSIVMGAAPVTSGCALPPVPGTVAPAPPIEAPKEMPKPAAEPAKDAAPKTSSIKIPSVVVPTTSIPVAPTVGGTRTSF